MELEETVKRRNIKQKSRERKARQTVCRLHRTEWSTDDRTKIHAQLGF